MDNLTNLKLLWKTTNTDVLPDATEMLHMVKNFRNRVLTKKWMMIVSAVLLTVMMVTIMLIVRFNFAVTYVGGLLIASSGFFLTVSNIKSLKRFYRLEDCSNKEFLDFIEQTRLNQIYYYKKTQVLIISACSVGLVLYLYEPATRNLFFTAILFVITTACLLFSWLVLRPRTFKANQQKLEDMRKRLEKISNQLK